MLSNSGAKFKTDSGEAIDIPKEHEEYVGRKKKEFIGSMLLGPVAGVAVTSAVLSLHAGKKLTTAILLQQVLYSAASTMGMYVYVKIKY